MLDGVLAGPDGRWGLNSCSESESPSTGGILSKVVVAPMLEPRGRVVEVVTHGEIVAGWDGGGDEEIEEGAGWFCAS